MKMKMKKKKEKKEEKEEEEKWKKIRYSLFYTISQIATSKNKKQFIPKQTLFDLTDLVFDLLSNRISNDLEFFANHGKRTLIKPPDVLLYCRRNESLKNLIERFIQINIEKEKQTKKRTKSNKNKTEKNQENQENEKEKEKEKEDSSDF
ncbi:centromere protein s [Anaeramoeba ignava]|uniref:Centromere protein s n=1 Tax=Anaeramoeba ignava TaxID=1746090 RepID=A0A9Q0R4K6_ANAIG|nr:centromere protein s [Anaeramoeba ignava]